MKICTASDILAPTKVKNGNIGFPNKKKLLSGGFFDVFMFSNDVT
jgi:hypothetical protein